MVKSLRRFGGGFQFETHTSTRPPPPYARSPSTVSRPPPPTLQLNSQQAKRQTGQASRLQHAAAGGRKDREGGISRVVDIRALTDTPAAKPEGFLSLLGTNYLYVTWNRRHIILVLHSIFSF